MATNRRRIDTQGDLRTAILDVARELFAKDGIEAVSMRRVADRVGCSATAIYLHFDDKDALVQQLCLVDLLVFARHFERLAKVCDPLERLRRAAHAYASFATERPNHYRLLFMTPRPAIAADGASATRDRPELNAYLFLKKTLADAIAQRLLRPEHTDADLLAQTFWAAIHGVVALHVTRFQDPWVPWAPLQTRIDAVIDGLLRGYGAT